MKLRRSTTTPNPALERTAPDVSPSLASFGRWENFSLPRTWIKAVLSILCALLLGSCHAGTWEDDPRNWSKAFNGQTIPEGVVVIHSKYQRSPHFTYEADYYFELKAPQEFLDAWLVGCVAQPPAESDLGGMRGRPAWFLPKPLQNYEMWSVEAQPNSNFRLFRDKETGVIFATDSEG